MASALVEISEAAGLHIEIEETRIPVHEDVRGACEILGFDPLYVANEGKFICFVPENQGEKALSVLQSHSNEASMIGKVMNREPSGLVTLKSKIGTKRIIDMLSGEQLPRIC
jgi:hydrogenase expression/formation protein HypE